MSDKGTHNRLDEYVRNTLSNIEVPYKEEHWNEFESKLSTTEPIHKINWKLLTNVFAGIVGVGGIIWASMYFISNKQESATDTANTKQEETTAAPSISNQPVQNENTSPAVATTVPEEKKVDSLAVKKEIVVQEKEITKKEQTLSSNETAKENAAPKEKKKKKKEDTISTDQSEPNFIGVFDSLKRTRVATFGDMIDPQKGFIKKTNEDPALQKAAQEKVNTRSGDNAVDNLKTNTEIKEKVFSDEEPAKNDSIQ